MTRLFWLCFSFCLFSSFSVWSQDGIRVQRAGFDSIIIYNTSPHSILLQISGRNPVYIYRNEGFTTKFRLTIGNVRSTEFRTSYDRTCFEMDEAICTGIRKTCFGCVFSFLPGNAVIGGVPLIFACTPEQWTAERSAYVAGILASNETDAFKKARLAEVCLECCKENEQKSKSECLETARYYLNRPPAPKMYRAQDLIPLQQKLAVDFNPYYITGFKQQGLTNLDFSQKRYYGFRTSINFNKYKNKKRVQGTQITVPFDFQTTPVGYKKNSNTALPDTGYSWRNYSVGIGYRFMVYENIYQNFLKNTGVLIDVGLSMNTRYRYLVNSDKVPTRIDDNIKMAPVGGYFHVGYQIALFRGVGVFGSYYTTFPFKKGQPVLEVPRLTHFNVGLNINLVNVYGYQY